MVRSFLLEIGTEEMPARFIEPALEQLKVLAGSLLKEKRIDFDLIKTVGTPRRMAVYVSGLSGNQQPLVKEVKGPALKVAYNTAGEPTPAALGFARSQGVDISDMVVKPVGPVEYIYASKRKEGRPTGEVLCEICPALITGLHFPKPMRWGDLDFRFARPIKWLLALCDNEVVDFELAGLRAGSVTYGHRFLSKGPMRVGNAQDYFEILSKAFVVVDPVERKKLVWDQVTAVAGVCNGLVEYDEELLNEITNLVEYPTAFAGKFDHAYLRLPKEVIVTPMREHQRYFPVSDSKGDLLPIFIGVRNGLPEHIDTVRAGNEKVLKARLADAAFFWDEDLKLPLANRILSLKKVVWQESLGTVYDKAERISALACFIGEKLGLGGKAIERVKRSAALSKTDLVTNMVYEFPELQGVMGREYALRSGEEPEVAEGIFEHYLPRFAGDVLPATTVGRILSLADKLDTIVGCFTIGIQPTGSQDPYALRRQALGICNIILDGNYDFSLNEVVAKAQVLYSQKLLKAGRKEIIRELEEFFRQRMKTLLGDRGFAYDIVEAVLSAGKDDILGTVKRVEAMDCFRKEPAFNAVITAYNRANNLSRKFEETVVLPQLFHHSAEKELYEELNRIRQDVSEFVEKKDYSRAFLLVAALREPVDRFFEAVMVMVEDERIRDNRLALLKNVVALVAPLADLSKIVVTG